MSKNMEKPKILYEDQDIIAVNKPAGMLTHKDQKSKEKISLSNWLSKKYPESKTVGELLTQASGEETDRAGIVHRLDKETSGVILLAKTQRGFDCLKKQFQEHTVKKTYHAFIVGVPKDERGIMDHPIGKSPTDFKARSASFGAKGEMREAVTQYMVKNSKQHKGGSFSFVQVMPKTGRTHQIRVHFKSIGHPLIGDKLYGKAENNLGFKRTALHSFSIEFKNCDGEKIKVSAPYPDDFEKGLKILQK